MRIWRTSEGCFESVSEFVANVCQCFAVKTEIYVIFSKYANNVSFFFRFVGQLCNVLIHFYMQDAYFEFLDKYFWKVSECLAKKCLKDLVI